MQKQLIVTADGSHTVTTDKPGVTYHSMHGAIQESEHVFIHAGLMPLLPFEERLHILEVGMGTGLNALLTLMASAPGQRSIHYTALEPFPLNAHEYAQLNYMEQLHAAAYNNAFTAMHTCEWEKDISIASYFTLYKTQQSLLNFTSDRLYHLVYFDAFAPDVQPELWTTSVFQHLHQIMHASAIIVTYCSKGDVRRAMQSAGFTVEKLKGAKGKREMLRAHKTN